MAICFDTETTGLPKTSIIDLATQPKIIEFAAIKINEKTLEEIDRLEFLVNPEETIIEKKASETHGLYKKDLEQALPFSAHYEKLCNFFLGEKYLFAHNLDFDMSLLKFDLTRIGRESQFPYPHKQICTVNATHHFNNYRLSLSKLYFHLFQEEMKEAHRAMVDVEHLTECVRELIRREIIKL